MPKLTIILLISCIILQVICTDYGLISIDESRPLNLLDLKTSALVDGPYVEIEHIHTYNNPFDVALETIFYFPRTEDSVFYKFEAILRNQTTVGRIFEKEKAKELYEQNKEEGHTVAFSERSAAAPDIMKIQVGNIPPHESVQIVYSVIQPLEVIVNKLWGFTLPIVVTERYAPASVDPNDIPNVVNVDQSQSSYNEWKIDVVVKSNSPFAYISNPSHHLLPELTDTTPDNSPFKVYEAKWNETLVPNRDFVVYFRPEQDLEQPHTILASHPTFQNDYVLLTTFVPELNNVSIEVAQNTLDATEDGLVQLRNMAFDEDIQNARGEFIFVIDRSGSMTDARIRNLKRALTKFLQILPKDSYFNIISFGSTYSLYSPESVDYTVANVNQALLWISTIDADMGGTEILAPLQLVTSIPLMDGYPRTVMVLTDGDVYNPDEIINHVRSNADKMRFFTVGIGNGASEYLIKNIAKAGKGTSQFVLDDEDIGDKAIYMIKAAISRFIEDIHFKIECFNDNQEQVFSQEDRSGLLLKDQPFMKWTYLKNLPAISSCHIRVDYYNSLRDQLYEEEFDIDNFASSAEITETWHKVAYDAMIKDLDIKVKSAPYSSENLGDEEELKSQIIYLSTKYQVMSDYTAFLAVVQEIVVGPNGESIQFTIPNMNSADYDEEQDNSGWGPPVPFSAAAMGGGGGGGGGGDADMAVMDVPIAESADVVEQEEAQNEESEVIEEETPSEDIREEIPAIEESGNITDFCDNYGDNCDSFTIDPVCVFYTEIDVNLEISLRNLCVACRYSREKRPLESYTKGLCPGDEGIKCENEFLNISDGQISPVCGLFTLDSCTDDSCRQTFAEPSAACHDNNVVLYQPGICPADGGISCEPYRPDAVVNEDSQDWWNQASYSDVCGYSETDSMGMYENQKEACMDAAVLYFTEGPC